MIANLRDTTQTNKEQDWLKTNLAKFSQMMQGQRSLESLAAAHHVASSRRWCRRSTARSSSSRPRSERAAGAAAARRATRYTQRKSLSNRFALGEGLSGSARSRRSPSSSTDVPDDYVHISSGLGEAPPRNIVVLPVLFEGQVKGVIELASFQRVQPDPHHLPRAADAQHRRRVQHDRRQHAHRGAARGAQGLERRAREAHATSSRRRPRCSRSRTARSREASASLEEKAQAARADLEVQVRVPREHVARAAHAAQQPADPGQAAGATTRSRTSRRSRSSTRRRSTPRATICSRSSTRSSTSRRSRRASMQIETRARRRSPSCATTSSAPSASRRAEGPRASRSTSAPSVPPTHHDRPQRLQQILKNLLSNAFKFTERGRVELQHRSRAEGAGVQERALRRRAGGARLRGHRHRHRHPRRQAAAHLRGVPAGRRLDQPHVRRHGPRPHHQPRARAPAGRRDRGREHAGRGQHLHALPAAARSDDARARRRRRGRATAARAPTPRAGAAAAAREPPAELRRASKVLSSTTTRGTSSRSPACSSGAASTSSPPSSAQEGIDALEREPRHRPGPHGHHDARRWTATRRRGRSARMRALRASCRSSRSPPRRCRATARSASRPGCTDFVPKPVDSNRLIADHEAVRWGVGAPDA